MISIDGFDEARLRDEDYRLDDRHRDPELELQHQRRLLQREIAEDKAMLRAGHLTPVEGPRIMRRLEANQRKLATTKWTMD